MKTEKKDFPGGVWPVMITPFCGTGAVDYEGLKKLTKWYLSKGCDGLFAVCLSSEMFQMTLEERLKVAETVVKTVAGRVPVIASGNICSDRCEQIEEVHRMAKTGVNAVILITNQFATPEEDDGIWMANCADFIQRIPEDIPLGLYECPYPYKRLISIENLRQLRETGRFYFLKDTCCDMDFIHDRLRVLRGSQLKLYNANSTTLLDSLRDGAAGFSGVMTNFHPQLYKCLYAHEDEHCADLLQNFLTVASLIQCQLYPANAKYYLQQIEGIPIDTYCRNMDASDLTGTYKKEVEMLAKLTTQAINQYCCQREASIWSSDKIESI